MAIRLIQGKIGSGKTYYAVNHVLKSYYTWSDDLDSWVPKEKDIDVRVYTNIKNMKLGEDLDKFIADAGGLSTFFNNKYQETFCMNSNVIYIIDEAQSSFYFPRLCKHKTTFDFFQTCRHVGVDVYFITQDAKCLAPELKTLAEYNIVAVPRSKSIGKCFTYKFYSDKEHFKTKRLKKDNKVFNLYRSMKIAETEKIRSILWKYIIMFILIVGLGVFMFKYVLLGKMLSMGDLGKSVKNATSIKVKKVVEVETLSGKGMFKIIGIADGNYIVKTPKGLKKVKIDMKNRKNINNKIRIEKL